MTPANDNLPAGQSGERILNHDRLQLSALMDGAIAPDQARFLLRRLQHDQELAGCWARWQLCGDVLRGHASAIVPAGFSQRVADAIAAEVSRPGQQPAGRWVRWGGGAALAASVAVIALFVSRQLPAPQVPAQAPARVVTASSTGSAPMSAPISPPISSSAPDAAAQQAVAVAVADVPRRMVRRSRGQSQRAATRIALARAPQAQAQVAIAAGASLADVNPFAPRTVVSGRPWPRALLPGSPASGAFTVEYGSTGAAPSFYPFAPRTLDGIPAQDTPSAGDNHALDEGGSTP